MLMFLATCMIVVGILHTIFQHWKLISMAMKIPSPVGIPFIGEFLLLLRYNFNIVQALGLPKNLNGDCFRLWARSLLVFVRQPADMEKLLTSPELHDRGQTLDGLIEVFRGDGLFTAKGEKAKELRKLFHKTFTCSSQDIIFEHFRIANCNLVEILQLQENQWIDIMKFIRNCSAYSIVGSALDINLDDYLELKKAILYELDKFTFLIVSRGISPLHRLNFLFNRVFGANKFFGLMERIHAEGEVYRNEMRCNFSELTRKGEKVPRQFAYNMLKEMPHATNEELFTHGLTVIGGALESSAATASFTLIMLAMHPEAQQLVFEEDRKIQEELAGQFLNERTLSKYKYLSCVVKESLRLFPPVPIVPRMANEDIKFGKYVVPKGATILGSILSLHRDPKIYDKPTVFDPDRFLPANSVKRSKFSFLPFGAGPRNCPGYRYGMQSAMYTVSSIVREFKVFTTFKTIDEIDEKLQCSITLNIIGGFPVRLERRGLKHAVG